METTFQFIGSIVFSLIFMSVLYKIFSASIQLIPLPQWLLLKITDRIINDIMQRTSNMQDRMIINHLKDIIISKINSRKIMTIKSINNILDVFKVNKSSVHI